MMTGRFTMRRMISGLLPLVWSLPIAAGQNSTTQPQDYAKAEAWLAEGGFDIVLAGNGTFEKKLPTSTSSKAAASRPEDGR